MDDLGQPVSHLVLPVIRDPHLFARHEQIAELRDDGVRLAVLGRAWDWLSGVR